MSVLESCETNPENEVEAPDASQQNWSPTISSETNHSTNDSKSPDEQKAEEKRKATAALFAPPPPDNSASLSQSIRDFPEDLKPFRNPVDMEILADEMAQMIKNYSVLSEESVDAIVLWILASYLINSFRIFSKLALISPEKRCGKTTTLEIIQALSKDALLASNLSKAATYRLTASGIQPTLIIDEADTYIKNGDPELVGIINSSHNKAGSTILRCQGDDNKVVPFSTWMPMVLASIGDLPPTIMDRSTVINLRRKKPSETVQKLPEDILDQSQPIRQKILRWSIDNKESVKNSTIEPPAIGNDRAGDNWQSLFQVAEQINSSWLNRCEAAYKALTQAEELELPTQLLLDIHEVFANQKEDRVSSTELLEALCQDQTKAWVNFKNGKQLTPNAMANMLKPYNIKPKTYRLPSGVKRGYEKGQFKDAFERYLPKPK